MMSAAATRTDPIRVFKFKLTIDGAVVALVSKMSALKMSTELVQWREGGDNNTQRNLPGKSKYEAITFEQGLVLDDAVFSGWVNQVNIIGTDNIGTAAFRKDIQVEVMSLDGTTALTYIMYGCWPSEFQALPELDANGNSVGIKTLKVECEGWKAA